MRNLAKLCGLLFFLILGLIVCHKNQILFVIFFFLCFFNKIKNFDNSSYSSSANKTKIK